jgi:hypothetical protein
MTTTRRLFLFTAAAAAPAIALPAIALPSPAAGTAMRLWAERQTQVDRLARASAEYTAASERLPAWAKSGPDRIDHEGNPCGHVSGWPLDSTIAPPSAGERIVRPSIYDCRDLFAFKVRVFGLEGRARARARAHMRQSIAAIVARLRERDRIYSALGLIDLDHEINAACDAIRATEQAIGALDQSPSVIAANVLASLTNDCSRSDFAEGNGYNETMAMALVVLRGLLPNVSGLIRDHAAFFVSNPTLPLSAMPFALL